MEKKPKWDMCRVTSSETPIPAVPGLYAIGHDETIQGLEIGRTYVYIGQTANLNRRFVEHSPKKELKPDLRQYLCKNLHHAKLWYTMDTNKEKLRLLEQELLDAVQPEFNIQGKEKR